MQVPMVAVVKVAARVRVRVRVRARARSPYQSPWWQWVKPSSHTYTNPNATTV